MEKGSMLVLAIIATLILSIILVAGLTVSTTEVHTTQNHLMNKMSYYEAIEGLEIVTQMIRTTADPGTIYVPATEFATTQGAVARKFITGTLVNFQNSSTQNVKSFQGFDPPPLPSISLGASTGVTPVIWYVPITAEVKMGAAKQKRSYTEIEAGIYSILMTGY
jgi:hypothetical protein